MLLVHATHEVAVSTLRSAKVDGSVGPTASSGWTCVWLDEESDRVAGLGFSSYLWADEGIEGLILEVRTPSTNPQRFDLDGVKDSSKIDAVAGTLVGLLGPARSPSDVRTLLSRGDLDAVTLWEGLKANLDLPELSGPEPIHCVVLTHGDAAMVRLAAAIAGPTWLAPVGGGWILTIQTQREDAAAESLAAAVSGATRRRDRTVLLWSHGGAFGLQIWAGGSMDASWAWATGWEPVISDWLEFETAVCQAIVPVQPDLHLPTLRALLRRKDLDEAGVAALLNLLGLPQSVADTLKGRPVTESITGIECVERATPRNAVVAGMRSDWAESRPPRSRPVYLAYAIGTAVAAGVCLAMTVLGIAVLATNGSAIDQAGATTEDQVFVGIFALLTLVLTLTAAHRVRRYRRSRGNPPTNT